MQHAQYCERRSYHASSLLSRPFRKKIKASLSLNRVLFCLFVIVDEFTVSASFFFFICFKLLLSFLSLFLSRKHFLKRSIFVCKARLYFFFIFHSVISVFNLFNVFSSLKVLFFLPAILNLSSGFLASFSDVNLLTKIIEIFWKSKLMFRVRPNKVLSSFWSINFPSFS